MASNVRKEVAYHLKNLAAHEEDPKRACFFCVRCLKLMPEWRTDVKQELLVTLAVAAKYVVAAEDRDAIKDVFQFFKDAARIYDDCEEFSHNFDWFMDRLEYSNSVMSSEENLSSLEMSGLQSG